MTLAIVLIAVLSLAFGALAVRDLVARNANLVVFTLCRTERPIFYWTLVAAEAFVAAICAILEFWMMTSPIECNEDGACTVTIEARAA